MLVGELLVDAQGTLTVTDQLDLFGRALAFDPGGGTSAAQLLIKDNTHQITATRFGLDPGWTADGGR